MADQIASGTVADRAVIYARYSSSGQREESIEGQIRDCLAYAERMNLIVVDKYTDHALSGTTDKRPAFQRMIRDSAKGKFTVVLCWKTDRFARNRCDSAIYKAKLRANGVRILYAMETIPDGPEGIVLESMMDGFAEYYSANLSQNVRRGLYDSALKLQTLGQNCYGLRKGPDGRFEQDPITAPIVRRIFEEYASGKTAMAIVRELNAAGYRTSQGNPFGKNTIARILKNQKYCGIYEYADIRVDDGIPAIITKALYERVQEMMKRHAEKPALKKTEGGFLLTGKLFCGHCGAPMAGDGGTSHTGRVYQYYSCLNRRRKKCDKERVSKQWIEDLIVDKLMQIAGDDQIINDFANHYMAWQEEQQAASPLVGMAQQLKRVETAIKHNMHLVDSGVITESIKQHLVDLEAEKKAIEQGMAQERLNEPRLDRTEVLFFLKKFRDGDAKDISWRIFLIETFLQAAYLYDDGRLLLHLNFSGDEAEITAQTAEEAVEHGAPLGFSFRTHLPATKETSFVYQDKRGFFMHLGAK